uniref:EF-hand domain-containing protein n=2 Tax=Tetraselmis sp. GSL018 TaxID=582737 RepID=A0A061R7Q7_9CHLO|eukprot:CAMPEP_0177599090 /NCGR_PEP_ID=MMETSP0419_2-20121207/12775_1 /TAXON_ID=582737 /ORGANISM="Tetraselmis sp., Strain GSL018" /LENGTH=574 /DNA_ID=CAMNT_0019091735 /DNA_START=54 /DNA_END=1778 /DNA_ORIENTATION=+
MVWWNEGAFDSPCFRAVAPFLGFTTNKNAKINDWRLGLLLRLSQLVVLGYVVWDIANQKSYLLREVPSIGFQANVGSVGGFQQAQDQALSRSPNYCLNSTEYEYSLRSTEDTSVSVSADAMAPIRCQAMDPELLSSSIGPSTILVATYMQEETTRYRGNVTSREACPSPSEVFGEMGRFAQPVVFRDGVCTYKLVEQTLPLVPENLTMGFSFSYTLPGRLQGSGNSRGLTCSLKSDIDEGITHTFEGNTLLLQAPVWKWLEFAHVSLDKDIAQRAGDASIGTDTGVEGNLPYARVTGLEMRIDVKVYNEGLQPYGSKDGGLGCIIELRPILFWTSGPTQVFRLWDEGPDSGFASVNTYGVMFTFSGGGSFGQLSYKLLINALIAGAVLLGVAHTLTTYVALYALGVRSKLYSAFIYEEVDYMREFARYSAQCLVAAQYFKVKDRNQTGTLDRMEMFTSLKHLFQGYLDDEEIAALTDFVIDFGDRSCKVMSDDSQGTISLEEWFNCFANNHCSVEMLKGILASEYNEKEKERLHSRTMALREQFEQEVGHRRRRHSSRRNDDEEGDAAGESNMI